MAVSYRLGVDWDGDGWVNWGVPTGTPPNLFRGAPFTAKSETYGKQYTTRDNIAEDVLDLTTHGYTSRSIQMGKDGGGDYGEFIHSNFTDYASAYQRHFDDLENYWPASVDSTWTGMYIPPTGTGVSQTFVEVGRQARTVNSGNGYKAVFGLDYNFGGVHGLYRQPGYHDVSNQYSMANGDETPSALSISPTPTASVALPQSAVSSTLYVLQDFTATAGMGTLTKVGIGFGANTGTPVGNVTVAIYERATTPPTVITAGTGQGSTTFTPTASSINNVTLSSPVTLITGRQYAVVLSCAVQVAGNNWNIQYAANNYAGGYMVRGDVFSVSIGTIDSGARDMTLNLTFALPITAATATWQGVPVVAGQNYTVTFWAEYWGAGSTTAKFRFYADSANSAKPYYNRTYIAGSDVSLSSGVAQQITYTFTAPVGSTQIALDVQATSATSEIWITGAALFDGTVTPSTTRIWDNQEAYNDAQFVYSLEAGQDYQMSFWVKSDDGLDALIGNLNTVRVNADVIMVVEDSHTIPVTSDWVRHDFYIPSRAYARGFGFIWTTEAGGVATGLGNVGTVEFSGFQLTAGSTVWPYHAGTSYLYDDITADAISITTKSGKNGFYEPMAYEGTAEITLNNSLKQYSPSNEDSILFGLFDQSRKVVLEVYDGAVWQPLWAGWTFGIQISAGENQDLRAVLTCQQGLFRLRDGTFSVPLSENVRMDELVRVLIESSGWKSTVVPFMSNVGFDTRVDENAYVLDPDLMFGTMDPGLALLELVGQDWGRKTDIEAALKEVLNSELASFWIDRSGYINVVNREFWINVTEPIEISIDTLPQAQYTYGENVINRAEVIINRRRQQTDATVWKTHRAFQVRPHKLPTDKVEIEIHAERVEGRQKTVINYTTEGMVKTVYSADPGMTYANTVSATTEQKDKVIVELIPVGGGNLYRLRITNMNAATMWVDIELKGDYLDTEDGTPVIVEDATSIELTEAVKTQKITTKVLDSEEQARSLGTIFLLRDSRPAGEFKNLMIRDEALEADLDLLLGITLGTKLSLSESQTVEDDRIHYVISEDIYIKGNVIEVTYGLARQMDGNYVIADHSIVGTPMTNQVEDWTNVFAFGDSTAVYDGEKISYTNTWKENALYLDPGVGQCREMFLGEMVGGTGAYIKDVINFGTLERRIVEQSSSKDYTLGPISFVDGAKYRIYAYMTDAFITVAASAMSLTKGTVDAATAVSIGGGGHSAKKIDFTMNTIAADPFVIDTLTLKHNNNIGGATTSHRMDKLTLVQRSRVKATGLDITKSYVYSVFARKQATAASGISYILKVRDWNGTLIGSSTVLLTNDIQKLEVAIPSGNKYVYATLESTTIASTDITHTIEIWSYGVTETSVTTYTDLLQPQTPYLIYP